ncbi:MAG TPA: Gfo/Idh/MocA family oxidoreductase [Planctomycetaceae bacterium]
MKTTRRQFLATAASAAAAFTIVPRHVLGGPGHVPPSEAINVALVGAGGRAVQNLRELFKEADCRVVAVADPVEHIDLSEFFYKGVAGRGPVVETVEKHYGEKTPGFKCAAYEDFRELLDKEKDLDAVLCSTPDHTHACVSVPAMRAGKHVYCEKPLTHNVWEARLMAQVAAETGVATQMGNQGHSNEGIRKVVEWLRAGAIGPVREVHAWASTSRWNKTLAGPPEGADVPAGVNWDLWLGPREERPYSPAYHPVAWRDFWDFGAGTLGDFGCHDLDAACWALDLAAPESIESRAAGYSDGQITPHGELVFYEFGPRGDMPPVKVTWYGGGLKPATPKDWPAGEPLPGRGVLFVGDKGVMFGAGAGGEPKLLGKLDEEFERPEPTIPRSKGHYRDWLDACKGGEPAGSNFAYGARLTELALLGVASLRLGKRIDWDAAAMKAKGLPEADAILKEAYRPGWEIG